MHKFNLYANLPTQSIETVPESQAKNYLYTVYKQPSYEWSID